MNFNVLEHNGSNAAANITANGVVLAIRAQVGGSLVARFLIDEDGEFFTVASGGTFDEYDDISLIEAYDSVRSASLKEVIDEEWRSFISEQEQQLIDLGVLGGPVVGMPHDNQGMLSVPKLLHLLTGNARQEHRRIEQLEEKLALTESKLAAIGA
jgi:hypothetical protein